MILMEHFTRRLEALIVDIIVVTLLVALINNIIYMILVLFHMPTNIYSNIVLIVVTLTYFTLFEAKTNKTIGKKILHLYVSDAEGYMSYKKAFIRNLTKLYWLPLIVDVLIGKILNYPSRLFDKIAGTDVYADDELEVAEEADIIDKNGNDNPEIIEEEHVKPNIDDVKLPDDHEEEVEVDDANKSDTIDVYMDND